MGEEFLEAAERHLPRFLSAEDKAELLAQVRQFETAQLFAHPEISQEPVLQGDGWRGLTVIQFETGDRKQVSGVVVSNACDISSANTRHLPPRLVFAPIVRLSRIEGQLRSKGFSEQVVQNITHDMRRQRTTATFFLPKQQYGPDEDSLLLLDDLHSIPTNAFDSDAQAHMFRLSQMGFWLFLIKLSIHFCRMNDGIVRG